MIHVGIPRSCAFQDVGQSNGHPIVQRLVWKDEDWAPEGEPIERSKGAAETAHLIAIEWAKTGAGVDRWIP